MRTLTVLPPHPANRNQVAALPPTVPPSREAFLECQLLFARSAPFASKADDRRAIAEAAVDLVCIGDGRTIPFHKLNTTERYLLVQGWVCYAHTVGIGGRQITDVLLPGDVLRTCSMPSTDLTSEAIACGPVHLVIVREDGGSPQARSALWGLLNEAQEAEAGRLRARLVSLGRRDARGRMAHFFVETYGRLQRAGLAQDGLFRCPLTQEQLADVLGLTAVHVNRTLQRLRAAGLLMINRPDVFIPDLDRLRRVIEAEHSIDPVFKVQPL